MTLTEEDAATGARGARDARVPRRRQLGEAGRSALGRGRRRRQGRQRHRQARGRPAPGVRPALAEDLPRPARGLIDDPAGGHRGLERAVRDLLAEDRSVLRAAGRDRARRGRAARDQPRCRARRSSCRPASWSSTRTTNRSRSSRPKGHTLSAWITFSAYRDGDVTVAQVQALERTSDPFDELAYMLGGNRMNNRFWHETRSSTWVGRWALPDPAVVVRGRVHRQAPPVAPRRATSATAPRSGRCATRSRLPPAGSPAAGDQGFHPHDRHDCPRPSSRRFPR